MAVEGGAAKMHFRLLLPNKQTGTVIGKGGANIKSIREASGCQVQISENVQGATDRLITIIGDSSVINTAVARLLAIIDEDPQASMIVDQSSLADDRSSMINHRWSIADHDVLGTKSLHDGPGKISPHDGPSIKSLHPA